MEHMDLLNAAKHIDAKLHGGAAPKTPVVIKESLFTVDDDPFGGNENNRRATERHQKLLKEQAEAKPEDPPIEFGSVHHLRVLKLKAAIEKASENPAGPEGAAVPPVAPDPLAGTVQAPIASSAAPVAPVAPGSRSKKSTAAKAATWTQNA